jgi:hypothetical protein
MTPLTELEQLKQQNALLLRALTRIKLERDALRKQIAALQRTESMCPHEQAATSC